MALEKTPSRLPPTQLQIVIVLLYTEANVQKGSYNPLFPQLNL